MIVTVGIIALNEENNITKLFDSILEQSFPKNQTEIVMADSGSKDNTKKLMQDFAKNYSNHYLSIKVIDNPKTIQPSGWNEVIKNSKGDVIIRVDAHAILTRDFIENNVKCIESGEEVCGGHRINIIDGDSKNKLVLLAAENSMFGSGIASYRRNSEKKYVNTVAHACYKKEIFEEVGFFDERLLRSEDNDMHYRIRSAGHRICMDNQIVSYYQTRPTLKGLVKQKYKNGKWIGITSIIKTPKMFSLYHFVPMLFVIVAFISSVLAIVSIPLWATAWWLIIPFIAGISLYGLIDLFLAIFGAKEYNVLSRFLQLCIIFPLLHFAYGIGTIIGVLEGKVMRK